MAKNIEIFRGGRGFDARDPERSRLVVNQRPADGHIKAATWEDRIRINRQRFTCSGLSLAVGDVIGIHTTPTFGVIDALGLAVLMAEEGLKLKVVTNDSAVTLGGLDFSVYEYSDTEKKYKAVDESKGIADLTDIGNKQRYYAGYAKPGEALLRITNPVVIALEVVALPTGGLKGGFDIESRLQFRQTVRPPAFLGCA